jgi:hypothetical protein
MPRRDCWAGASTCVNRDQIGKPEFDVHLHADLELKEKALARTTPANTKPGRYKPPDQLLAFLEGL